MTEHLRLFFENLWEVILEAGPWLVLGLIVSGMIKAWLSTTWMTRWLGGRGAGPVIRAALIGTPLPLCSCSVVPAAITVRRAGASKGATVSFLIATPENGADSLALSYALLGWFMTLVRPIAAIISAIVAGLLTALFSPESVEGADPIPSAETKSSCCCKTNSGADNESSTPTAALPGILAKLKLGLRYAMFDLFTDIALWLAVGLALAALINTLVPPEAMAQWGSGPPAMLLMLLIGIPMYICATASTPIAAAMLIAGVSPGTVLVFLLAGPATNLGTIGIVRRELGTSAAATYLISVAVGAVAFGLLTDAVVQWASINVVAQASHHQHLAPISVSYLSAGVLILLTIHLLWKRWRQRTSHSIVVQHSH